MHDAHTSPVLFCSILAAAFWLIAFASPLRAASQSPIENLSDADPASLFTVTNGSVASTKVDGQIAIRWSINAGQTSELSLKPDTDAFARIRSFDRIQFEFRIASGTINTMSLSALGHVSGPRAHRVHQGDVALLTTAKSVWHAREWDFNRPSWLPWVNEDGDGADAFFRFSCLALEPGTVVELRNVRFVRGLVQIKPFFESPVTWPVKTENADGSVTYRATIQAINAAAKPTTITAKILSQHAKFQVALDKDKADVKNAAVAHFNLTATLSKADIDSTPELFAEPLRIAFANVDAPDAQAWYTTRLVRPLSKGLRTQVLVAEEDLRYIREKLASDKEFSNYLGLARMIAPADKFLPIKLVRVPTQTGHSMNSFPAGWEAGDYMPEIVNTKTGERQALTNLASVWWQSFLNVPGNGAESLGMAYLLTGDEKYAQKAVDLIKLYAQQYESLPWNTTPFNYPQGPVLLANSRVSATSTYGTNWLFKGHLRMLSAISQSKAWADAPRAEIYQRFVLPYATEVMKFPGGISNMTDITNHNLLLLGFLFDDAGFIYHATQTDSGLASRLRDITADGFSSEGRPISYHFAAMAEYLPSIGYIENAGLKLDYPKDRIPAAIRMSYQRASLTGSIPNTGDCGRSLGVGSQSLADHLITLFPQEKWLFDIGSNSTLTKKVRLHQAANKPAPDAWRALLETTPRLFPDAGLAVLRQGSTPETQISITLDYGRNFFHAALDRLQFTLLAFGKTFTHGPGSLYNVGSGNMTRTQDPKLDSFIGHGTLAHNLVLVDATDQSVAVGKLLAWNEQPDLQLAVAAVEGVRPGVSYTRGVALTQGIVFMFDKLESQDDHTYDFAYHNFGALKPGEGWTATPQKEPLAKTGNYENIGSLARLAAASEKTIARLDWDLASQLTPADEAAGIKAMGLALWHANSPGGELYTGVTGLNNPNTRTIPDAAPSFFHRVKGKNALFLTVLEPHTGKPRVNAVTTQGDAITVTLSDGKSITLSMSKMIAEFPAKK